jgi:hypothetical protein
MASATNVGVRWTIGDVSPQGFEALRLSVLGARKVFGPRASYAICMNSVPLAAAPRSNRRTAVGHSMDRLHCSLA